METLILNLLSMYQVSSINLHLLNSSQKKEGSKHFLAAPFFESFFPLAAEKKDSKNGAARKFLAFLNL